MRRMSLGLGIVVVGVPTLGEYRVQFRSTTYIRSSQTVKLFLHFIYYAEAQDCTMFCWSILNKKNSRNRTDREHTNISSQQFGVYFFLNNRSAINQYNYFDEIPKKENWINSITLDPLMFNTNLFETAIQQRSLISQTLTI